MARNIQSIVMVMGLVVCSVMVLQVSSQSSGCPAPANVTWCSILSRVTNTCNNGSPVVTMPNLAQILAAPVAALGSLVAGIARPVLTTLGNFLVGFGNALINLANSAATTTAAPTAAPVLQFRPLGSFMFGR